MLSNFPSLGVGPYKPLPATDTKVKGSPQVHKQNKLADFWIFGNVISEKCYFNIVLELLLPFDPKVSF